MLGGVLGCAQPVKRLASSQELHAHSTKPRRTSHWHTSAEQDFVPVMNISLSLKADNTHENSAVLLQRHSQSFRYRFPDRYLFVPTERCSTYSEPD